jgi:alanine transaminase
MITISDLNPAILKAQYAVRGRIALKAEQSKHLPFPFSIKQTQKLINNNNNNNNRLRTTLQKNPEAKHELGFDSIINCNIGNPQQLGQKPITFSRQVEFFCPSLPIPPPSPTHHFPERRDVHVTN